MIYKNYGTDSPQIIENTGDSCLMYILIFSATKPPKKREFEGIEITPRRFKNDLANYS